MDRWIIGHPRRGQSRQFRAIRRGTGHYDRGRRVMDMRRPGGQTVSWQISVGCLVIVPVYMGNAAVVVRMDLALPDAGQEQP